MATPPLKSQAKQENTCYTILYEGVTLNPGEPENHFSAPIEDAIANHKKAGCYVALVSERDRSQLPEEQRKLVDLQSGARDWKSLNKYVRKLARKNRARVQNNHNNTFVDAHGGKDKKGRIAITMTRDGYEIALKEIRKETRRLGTDTYHVALGACYSGVGEFFGYRNIAVVSMGGQNEVVDNATLRGIFSMKGNEEAGSPGDRSFLQLIQEAHEKDFLKTSLIQYHGKFSASTAGKIIDGPFPQITEVRGHEALNAELQKIKKVGSQALVLYLDDQSPLAARNYVAKLEKLNQKYRGNFKCIIARAPRGSRNYWQEQGIALNRLRPTLDWVGPYYHQTHRVKNTINPMGRDYLRFTLISPKEVLAFYQSYIHGNENLDDLMQVFGLLFHDDFSMVEKILPQLFEFTKGDFGAVKNKSPELLKTQWRAYAVFNDLAQRHPQVSDWLQKKLADGQALEDRKLAFQILSQSKKISSQELVILLKYFLEKEEGSEGWLAHSCFQFFQSAEKLPDADLQKLEEILQDSNISIKLRIQLAAMLWRKGNSHDQPTSFTTCRLAFDFLLSSLKSPMPEVRDQVYDEIHYIYYFDRLIPMKTRKLTKALETESDPSIRFYLMSLLQKNSKQTPSKQEIEFWINGLREEDPNIIRSSLDRLLLVDSVELQANAAILIPILQPLLKHPVTAVKMYSCKLLGLLGEKAQILLPDLRELSKDDWDHTIAESFMARQKIAGLEEVSVEEWQALWSRPLMIEPGRENSFFHQRNAREHRATTIKNYIESRGYDEVAQQATKDLVIAYFEERNRENIKRHGMFDEVLYNLASSASELEQLCNLLRAMLNSSDTPISPGAHKLLSEQIEKTSAYAKYLKEEEQSRKQPQQATLPFNFNDKNFITESMKLLNRL